MAILTMVYVQHHAMRHGGALAQRRIVTGMDLEVGVPVPSPKLSSGTSGLVSG
jgi:hypothetical protein